MLILYCLYSIKTFKQTYKTLNFSTVLYQELKLKLIYNFKYFNQINQNKPF